MAGRWTYPIVPDCMSITFPSTVRNRALDSSMTARVDATSALGSDVHVAEGAIVENCVLGDGVRVGAGSILRQVVVGDNTVVGRDCSVGPYVTIAKNVRAPRDTCTTTDVPARRHGHRPSSGAGRERHRRGRRHCHHRDLQKSALFISNNFKIVSFRRVHLDGLLPPA